MSVFVDDARLPYGRMLMCHMWADTLDELLGMADRIGVKRRWLQRPAELATGTHPLYAADPRYRIGMDASWVHFDIARVKRVLAVAAGAIETDRFGPFEHETKLMLASGCPSLEARAATRLERLAAVRTRRAAE